MTLYAEVTPVSKNKHLDLCVKTGVSYEFARSANTLPLMAIEFPSAAPEYPIVFAGKEGQVMPIAILGVKDRQNLFITDDGAMDANYIPAVLRRYPFIFSTAKNDTDFLLCIDESFAGCNRTGIGERLFDAEDVGVGRGRSNEVDDWSERLIRVV